MVELNIFQNKKALFFDRKFELHSLMSEQKHADLKSLKFLLNLTVTKKDVGKEREVELKNICIKQGINHPIVGDEYYDPKSFDYSRLP